MTIEPNPKPCNVLIVDDSSIVAQNIKLMIEDIEGVSTVYHSLNLNRAYVYISDKKPCIVFLDIQLKNETGFELLEFLAEKHPEIIVIMISNLSHDVYRKKSMEMGAHFFIDKSTEFEKLPEIIMSMIKKRSSDINKTEN